VENNGPGPSGPTPLYGSGRERPDRYASFPKAGKPALKERVAAIQAEVHVLCERCRVIGPASVHSDPPSTRHNP